MKRAAVYRDIRLGHSFAYWAERDCLIQREIAEDPFEEKRTARSVSKGATGR